jgi:formin-binding protein 1
MRVRCGYSEGLVPASYVEATPASPTAISPVAMDRPSSTYSNSSASVGGGSTKKKGPAVAPKRGAKKLKYVEALYDYEARSDAEWSMSEGEKFVLVNRDAGDGWADVEKGGVVRSVPANYIQDI